MVGITVIAEVKGGRMAKDRDIIPYVVSRLRWHKMDIRAHEEGYKTGKYGEYKGGIKHPVISRISDYY